jgi:glutathione S-transferase
MKLFSFGPAPSAQRVQVFLAEKGLTVETVEVNVREGRQFAEPLSSMNPFHCVPFLELDDGTVVTESLSICRYLEELNPEPTLFGITPTARAVIDMWSRHFELDGIVPMLLAVRNRAPMFAGRVVPGTRTDLPQLPTLAERGKQMMEIFLGRIEPHFGRNAFAAGDMFSIADITGYFAVRSTRAVGLDLAVWPNVERWFADVSARPAFRLAS